MLKELGTDPTFIDEVINFFAEKKQKLNLTYKDIINK